MPRCKPIINHITLARIAKNHIQLFLQPARTILMTVTITTNDSNQFILFNLRQRAPRTFDFCFSEHRGGQRTDRMKQPRFLAKQAFFKFPCPQILSNLKSFVSFVPNQSYNVLFPKKQKTFSRRCFWTPKIYPTVFSIQMVKIRQNTFLVQGSREGDLWIFE